MVMFSLGSSPEITPAFAISGHDRVADLGASPRSTDEGVDALAERGPLPSGRRGCRLHDVHAVRHLPLRRDSVLQLIEVVVVSGRSTSGPGDGSDGR